MNEHKEDVNFQEIKTSSKSLSQYDEKTFKTILPQIMATLMSVSLNVAMGLSMSFSGIIIPALDQSLYNTTKDINELYATKEETAWIASVMVIAVPLGSIASGILTDTLGRLWPPRISVIPTVVGWSLIASANNIPQLIIGRLFTGFANPLCSISTTVYVSEIASADIRGSLLVIAPTLVSAGMLLTFLEGWFLHWRTVAWISNFFTLCPLILLFLIPESPPWLFSKGRIDEAAKSLKWFHRYQPQPNNRNETYAELQLEKLQWEQKKKLNFHTKSSNLGIWGICKEFAKPTGYKPTLILTGLFFFQMFSSVYITLFYSVTFLQKIGSNLNPYMVSVLICSIRMSMAFANSYLLKKFNRRFLIMFSATGMAIFMTLSGFTTKAIIQENKEHTYLPVIFILCYVLFSMLGLLCIPWTMISELYPLEIRGVANSLAYSIGYMLMFASIQSFYGLLDLCNGIAGVQFFFAAMSMFGCIYTYVFVPETHKKTLDEITDYFEDSIYFLTIRKNKRTKKIKTFTDKKNVIIKNVNEQNEKLLQTV